MSYGSLFFLAAATVLWYSYRRAVHDPAATIEVGYTRHHLAIIPYSLLYVLLT